MEEAELVQRLGAYAAAQMPGARDVAVTEIARITGGGSGGAIRPTA